MSLYDIMSKRPVIDEEPEGQEVPVAAPVQQEVVQAAPVLEPAAEKKDRLWWWQTPDFMGAVAAQEKAAEKRMEQEKKRARRQRNMAILGDIARLGAQTGAIAGGAWIADPFTPATEKANDNLAALRERHAAEVAAFARQRAAAQEKLAADNNAKEKFREALENEERKDRQAVAEHQYKVQRDQVSDAQKAAELAWKKENAKAEAEAEKQYRDGVLANQREKNRIQRQYNEGMLKLKKATLSKDESGNAIIALQGEPAMVFGKDFYERNLPFVLGAVKKDWENNLAELQHFKYEVGDVKEPTEEQLERMLEYSPSGVTRLRELYESYQELTKARALPVQPTAGPTSGEKKKNPMGSGKKANPMN